MTPKKKEPKPCPSVSPVYPGDEGPCHCRLEEGHAGDHWAKDGDARYIRDERGNHSRHWGEDRAGIPATTGNLH